MASMSGRMPRSERGAQADRTPVGIHIGLGTVVVLAAVMLAATLPSSAGAWRLMPVAAALAVVGVCARPVAVAFVATVAYLLVVGFLVNQYGVLTWDGMPDMYRLLVIVISAGGGRALGALRRRFRRSPPLTVPATWSTTSFARTDESMFIDKEDVSGV